jgi:hypothetical protein
MSITADLQSQKGPLPKCCPPMSNVTNLLSDVTKNVQRCPKDGVAEQVRGHLAEQVQEAV